MSATIEPTAGSKARRVGALTDRLVDEPVMSAALRELLIDTDRWILCVDRSPISWETGERQVPYFVLHENGDMQFGDALDSRLVRSRRVNIVASWSDGSVAVVDLRGRRYDSLTLSPLVVQRMNQFNAALKAGDRSRLYTPAVIALLALWPIFGAMAIAIIALTVDVAQDPVFRANLFNDSYERPSSQLPEWARTVAYYMGVLWPLSLPIAIGLSVARLLSGGLRTWPKAFSRFSILSLFYRIRAETTRVENWRSIGVGATIAVISVLVTLWLT